MPKDGPNLNPSPTTRGRRASAPNRGSATGRIRRASLSPSSSRSPSPSRAPPSSISVGGAASRRFHVGTSSGSTSTFKRDRSKGRDKLKDDPSKTQKAAASSDVPKSSRSKRSPKLNESQEPKKFTDTANLVNDLLKVPDPEFFVRSCGAVRPADPKEPVESPEIPSPEVNAASSPKLLSKDDLETPMIGETTASLEQPNIEEASKHHVTKEQDESESEKSPKSMESPEVLENSKLSKMAASTIVDKLETPDISMPQANTNFNESSKLLGFCGVAESSQERGFKSVEFSKPLETKELHKPSNMQESSEDELFLDFETSEDSVNDKEPTIVRARENPIKTKIPEARTAAPETVESHPISKQVESPSTKAGDPVGDQELRITTETAQQTSDAVATIATGVKNTQTFSEQEDAAVQTTTESNIISKSTTVATDTIKSGSTTVTEFPTVAESNTVVESTSITEGAIIAKSTTAVEMPPVAESSTVAESPPVAGSTAVDESLDQPRKSESSKPLDTLDTTHSLEFPEKLEPN